MTKIEEIKTSKKDLIFLFILLLSITVFGFWAYNRTETRDEVVKNKGSFFLGRITKKTPVGNSGGNSIDFTILYEENLIEMSRMIDKPYWLTLNMNDTILVKAIISDSLKWEVVLEEKHHLVSCLKEFEQPSKGWVELPTDKCDREYRIRYD